MEIENIWGYSDFMNALNRYNRQPISDRLEKLMRCVNNLIDECVLNADIPELKNALKSEQLSLADHNSYFNELETDGKHYITEINNDKNKEENLKILSIKYNDEHDKVLKIRDYIKLNLVEKYLK